MPTTALTDAGAAPPPLRMAAMGPQRQPAPASAAQARARYFNSANAFNIQLPAVPAHSFAAEAQRALDADTPTGYIACDQSDALGCDGPATTPLMLARYARIAAGDALPMRFASSGTICFVIAGTGTSDIADIGGVATGEHIAWSAGDVIFFPGGPAVTHRAAHEDAVLWLVSDEPLLAFDSLRAAPSPWAAAVHCPAVEIRRQLALLHDAVPEATTSGRALIFSSDALAHTHNIHPLLTLSLNTLPPGDSQPAHRHNSAAITLIVDGDGCHSMVDGQAAPWQRWHTMVTPPGAAHSHHNGGDRRALFLIVQDGGLHYRARTMGFQGLPSAS